MNFLQTLKILIGLILVGAGTGHAVTKTWLGSTADWNYSNNWSPSGAPATTDDVQFDNTSSSNCQLTSKVEVQSIAFTSGYTGTFDFQSYNMIINGSAADFRMGGTLTAGTGSLIFTGTGIQLLHSKPGTTHPRIVHDGVGTLQLETNSLTTKGFLQIDGAFDFNGWNVTTVSGGDFSIHNGGSGSLVGLGSRTITVAGNAILLGRPGNELGMATGVSQDWTLAVTGSVFGDYLNVGRCNATVNAGVAFRSTDVGNNTAWSFAPPTFFWNRSPVHSNAGFLKSYNWANGADGSGYRPPTADDDNFTADALGGDWTFRDFDNYAGTGANSLTARADQLQLTGRGQPLGPSYNEYVVADRSDITGNFDVTVKVVFLSPGEANAEAGIVAADDLTSLGLGGYCALGYNPGTGEINFRSDVDGTGNLETSGGVTGVTGPVWLRLAKTGTSFRSWYRTTPAGPWTIVQSATTIASTAANSRIGLFSTSGDASRTTEAVFDDFHGGTDMASGMMVSFNGTGADADANATLDVNASVHTLDFTGYTGTFDFSNYILNVTNGNATFVSAQTITAGTGTLVFSAASGTQTFTPKSGATFPGISKSGAGTLTVATNGLWASDLSISAGTWNWGASSLTHSITSMTTTGGTMTFGSNTVSVTTGNVDFGSLATLNANSGTLQFTATTGTQTFTPKAGANHPGIVKSGGSTLAVSSNGLACASLAQSAGTVQFGTGSLALTTTGALTLSGGSFNASTNTPSISVGTNLAITGGTLTATNGTLDVDGNLDMSSGNGSLTAPSSNTFNVGGSFSVGASATFTANSGTVTMDATSTGKDIIANGGNFANLTFAGSGGGWTPTAHITAIGTLTLTTGTLDISTNGRTLSVANFTQNGGTLTATAGDVGVTGNFTIAGGTFTAPGSGKAFNVAGNFTQSGGTISAGSGTITLNATATQSFRASSTLNEVSFNGSGAVWTIVSSGLTASVLNLSAGTLNLGSGLVHAITTPNFTGGTLEFGSSTLRVTGATVNLTSLTTLTANTGILEFFGSSPQTFTPKVSTTHPTLEQDGSGGTTIATNNLTANGLTIQSGTFNLGTSLNHTVTTVSSGGGTLDFSNSVLRVSGATANLGSLAGVTPGTGYLEFIGSGGQAFTPKSGASHPTILQSGSGTTTVSTNHLNAAAASATLGTLDVGTRTMTLTGNLSVNGGTLEAINGNLTVGGNVAIASGTLSCPGGGNFYIAGDFTQTGSTLTSNSGTVTLNGTATGKTLNVAGSLGNMIVNGSGGAWTVATNNLSLGGGLTVTAGTLNPSTNSLNLNVGGGLTINGGTLSAGNSNLDVDGNFNLASGTLTCPVSGKTFTVAGNFAQASGSTITYGTGTLTLDGSGTGRTVDAYNTVGTIAFTGSGDRTLTSALWVNTFTMSGSTLNLGSGLTHGVNTTSVISGGSLDFGSSTWQVDGHLDLSTLTTLTPGTGTLWIQGAGGHNFTPKNGATHPHFKTSGTANVSLLTYNLSTGNMDLTGSSSLGIGSLSLTVGGNLTLSGGTLGATSGTLDVNGNLSVSSGTLNCPSGTLSVTGNVTKASGATWTHNSGTLLLDGTVSGKTIDFASGNLYNMTINGGSSGEWTVVNNALSIANTLSCVVGNFEGGSSLTHAVGSIASSGGTCSFDLNTSTMNVSGNADLSGVSAVTTTGALYFTGSSGVQIFTPKSGGSHPSIGHSGASELELATNNLSCQSFSQSAGSLDFAGRNITTAGAFSITNGTSSTLIGLAGRTLTVGGNAVFYGAASTSRLNANPGAAWTLAVTGTLNGSMASLDFSTASVSAGSCSNCANQGSNSNWTFAVSWDGGGADANWNTANNWGSDYVPTTLDDVAFNATSLNCNMNGSASVRSITFTSGYSGTFSTSSNNLTINTGNADFRSGGAISATTGSLIFTSATAQIFIPKASTQFPWIVQNGSGGTTISTNALTAGGFTLTSGTLNLGTSLTHTIGGVSGAGGLNFGSSSVDATGNVDLSSATVTATSANTLAFTGTSAQTYTPNTSEPDLNLTQNGSGGTTVASNNFSTPTLTISAGTFNLGTGRAHNATTLTASGGGLDFGSSTISLSGATQNLSALGTLTPGTGTMFFTGGSAQTFTPKASHTYPDLDIMSSGGVTIATNNLTSGAIWMEGGALNLGTSLTHTVTAVNYVSGGGTINFGSSTLQVTTGNATLGSLTTVTRGTGTLAFTAGTGIQIFTPKAGQDHPAVTHSGAGTLRIATNDLSCASFSNSAGILDLNGRNLTTIAGGDFTISSGASSTMTGLSGRTISVAGNASLAGSSSASRLNLNPGAAWTLAVTGTLTGSLASVGNSNASVSAGSCTNCANTGSNTNWTFTVAWDGGGGDANWTTAANWASDYVPTSLDAVSFSSGSANAVLDAAATVKTIQLSSGYSGNFNFSSNTLTVLGNADFSCSGTITPGTGGLELAGTGSHTFYPLSGATLPAITQTGSGTYTLTAYPLGATGLTVSAGTFHLGSSLTHTLGSVSGSGTLDFGGSSLNATGNVDLSGLTVNASSSNTLAFTGSSAQTYTPKASVTGLGLTQNGSGGTTVSTNNFTTGTLTMVVGTLNLGTGRTHTASALSISGGGLEFSSSTLQVSGATVNFSSLASLSASTGTLSFTGSSAQTFTPKASLTFPGILQNGSGGTTIATNNLTADVMTITAGTMSLGSGRTHQVSAVTATGGGLDFGSSILQVSGNANFAALSTLTPGTGTLAMNKSSGTQVLTPKSGATHPAISHNSAGTLQLATNALTCAAFSQNSGVLDLNGMNVTTVSSGDFTLTGGTSSSLAGLAGRTVTVAGNATFTGASSTSRLNLNPGSAWTLAVSGTLSASLASLDYSNASVTTGTCANCANGGNNTAWSFAMSWDGGGGDANWSSASNWAGDAVPTSLDAVTFDAGTANATLDAAVSIKSITFTSGYSGTFSFSSNTLTINSGNADFRSGGAITAGTGTLAFTSTSSQLFYPKSGATHPALVQNGSGGTTLTANSLTAGNLTLSSGTLFLGSGLTHAVGSVSGSGALDFGTSNLNATGNVDLSGLTVTASASNTLGFTGGTAQTYTPKASVTALNLTQNGSGGTTVATNDFTTPTLTLTSGTFNLGLGRSHTVTAGLSINSGGLNFNSSTLKVASSPVDLRNLATLSAGSGTLEFTGSSAQNFYPKSGASHPNLIQSGTGGATVNANALTAGSLTLSAGSFDLGAGFSHQLASLATSGGSLAFNSSTLQVSGDANFSGLAALTPGSGTLAFNGSSGTQVFTPRNGSTHPAITHQSAGTLQLATYDLACASFSQNAGYLDLNGKNLTTQGDFTISTSALPALSGLAGRTLTVGGNATFTGAGNALLSMNPTSAWTLAATGSLTVSYANLRNCNASATAGTASNTADQGSNTNWSYAMTWTGGGADNFWFTGANWGGGAAPTSSMSVLFDATSVKNVYLDGDVTLKAITLSPAYTGVFDFGSANFAVTGNADLRTGGTFAFSASAQLEMTGTAAQTLYPKTGQGLPNLRQSGAGGTTLAGGNLSAGNLNIAAGSLNLGAGFTHNIKDLAGSGAVDFGSSVLQVTGNADFTGLASVSPGSGELAFTGTSSQTFLPGTISAFPALRQNGSGGTTVSNAGFTTPALRIDIGTFRLGSSGSTSTVTTTFAATGGGLDFGSGTLRMGAAAVDLNPLTAITAGTGTLELTGTSQTLAPKAGATHPTLTRNGNGTATLITRGWSGAVLKIQNGTMNLGAGLSHTFTGVVTPNNGVLEFASSAVQVSGNADFNGLSLVDGGTGSLTFSAPFGTQTFTPELGSPFPAIYHTGTGTLTLSVNDLSCAGFYQNAGALDLNGRNITVAAGGTFLVSNGGTGTLVGLGGRTLTVGGNATFKGIAGARLAMSPGLSWALAVTGTLKASNVDLRNCSATGAAGIADSSSNLGGNANWTFMDTVPPANISGFAAAAINGNAVGLSWSASAAADADSVVLRYRIDGAFPANPADGFLWRKVHKSRTADTATGLPDKTVFHFAAFVKDSAGNLSAGIAGARDTARTPDVTPPANVTALAATALSAGSVALAWTASASSDADSVQIRYLTGTAYPATNANGTLWRTLSNARAADTITGLSANTIYAVGIFVRDTSGNFSARATAAQDSALWQNPVTGSLAFIDAAGKTANPIPKVTLAGSAADSVRISLLADTTLATWLPLHSTDSINAAAGADGKRIAAAQYKNVFGTRSPWYRDTTVLDRFMPAPVLNLAGPYSYLTWPNSAGGKAVDSLAGTDTVYVQRQRESDNAWYNGTAWGAAPDTARLRADSTFGVPLTTGALISGFYNIKAWAKDKLGNVSAPVTARIRYDANRAPQAAADSVRDSVLQNQTVSWILDMGDLDLGDTITTLSVSVPAWLAKTEVADTAKGGFTTHRIYTFAGKPVQSNVGAHTLTVQAKDVGGQTFTWSRNVKVVDVNDPPVFANGQDSLSIKEDSVFRFVAKFADPDPADKPVLSVLSGPGWATLADSTLVLKPGSRDVGPAPIRLLVSDGKLLDTLDINVMVQNVNDAPVAFPAGAWPSSMRWSEDIVDTFSVVVVDMDRNDNVTLAGTLPGFLSFQIAMDSTGYNRTFRFTAKPVQQDAGAYNLKLQFQDKAGSFSELPLHAVVNAVNDLPSASITGIEVSGGAARAGLDAQDPDGSLAQTRFHYRVIASNGDTVRSGICPAPPLYLHPLADGAYSLAVAAEDEGGLKQPVYAVAAFSISGATSLTLDSARWHMIAYPGRALSASALGAGASAATWDEAAADGSPLGRYATGKAADSLMRGKGYWVRTARRAAISVPLADLLEKPFTLKLSRGKQGWNQIGNPYPYPVDLSATGLTFWEWDVERRDLVNARGLLKPWAAYWVQVAKDTVLTIKPDPFFPSPKGNSQGQALAKAAWNHGSDWTVQLSLSAGPYHDAANFLGIRPVTPALPSGAPAGMIADAPKFGDYVALHFDAPDAAQGFAADIRPALDADEEWWDFSVENSGTGLGQASLSLPGLEALGAAGLYAFVVHGGQGPHAEAIALEPGTPATLAMEGPATRYSLVVTPHADFASRLKGSFSLSQNYPNPVATATTFRFFLPQAWGADGKRLASGYKVRLNVYDYAGRRVARVAEGLFKPGSHALIWHVRGQGGQSLASGNYVYRLEAPGFVKSLKLLVK